MRSLILVLAALAAASCAALRSGWARVTYVEGRISPALECTSRIAGDGEVELTCRALNNKETELLWKHEHSRTPTEGEI